MNRPYIVMLGNVIFPVAPGEISLYYPSTGQTARLINGTEINLTKPAGLCVYKMRVLIPRFNYPFCGREPQSQDYYLRTIHSMYKNREQLSLIIWRTNADGSMNMGEGDVVVSGDGIVTGKSVTLDSYRVIEDANEGFDIWLELEMREYVGYGTRRYLGNAENKQTATEHSQSNEKKPLTYTVKKGDCLSNICKLQLGSSDKWREVARLNGLANPNKIYVGQVIRLRE